MWSWWDVFSPFIFWSHLDRNFCGLLSSRRKSRTEAQENPTISPWNRQTYTLQLLCDCWSKGNCGDQITKAVDASSSCIMLSILHMQMNWRGSTLFLSILCTRLACQMIMYLSVLASWWTASDHFRPLMLMCNSSWHLPNLTSYNVFFSRPLYMHVEQNVFECHVISKGNRGKGRTIILPLILYLFFSYPVLYSASF